MYGEFAPLLVTLSALLAALHSATVLPPYCDWRFSSMIRTYWNHTWPVANVTFSQVYYKSGRMRLIAATNSSENLPYKCKILNFYPNKLWHGISAMMEFENDGEVQSSQVREKDGFLILPDYVFVYNIIVSKGIYAAYKCTEYGSEVGEVASSQVDQRPPEAFVAAVDEANDTDISNALGVMELIGFNLNHKFNCSGVLAIEDDANNKKL